MEVKIPCGAGHRSLSKIIQNSLIGCLRKAVHVDKVLQSSDFDVLELVKNLFISGQSA